jgi:hypothetical protein
MSHVLNSMIAFAGCSIAAAVTVGAAMSAGGTQAAMPTSEWRSLLDQRVVLVSAPHHEPRMQRPASTVITLIGQGWG